jgi:hypothetical protein
MRIQFFLKKRKRIFTERERESITFGSNVLDFARGCSSASADSGEVSGEADSGGGLDLVGLW